MRYARVIFIIVVLLCGLETVRLWLLAPDVMAAHFNVLGNPDRFVPRFEFFSSQVKTMLVVLVACLVIQALPLILPMRMINMSNREYWMATSEKQEIVVERMSSFSATFCAIIVLVMQAGFELAVSANLQKPIVFAAQLMVPVIVGFIVLSFALLFWLGRSFRLPG